MDEEADTLARRKFARDAMEPVCILIESAPLPRAAALLVYENAQFLVAISQHGAVVGTLSLQDIARWVAPQDGFSLPPRKSDRPSACLEPGSG